MKIKSAEYIISCPSVENCPKENYAEFAFIGRSNVGKSSLINLICQRKNLAKTSATPGKTQLLNYFLIGTDDGAKLFFVDLPGYGFAKVSQQSRLQWKKMIENYLSKRQTLALLFILIDSRHKPQQLDLDFVAAVSQAKIPFAFVFTKSDKSTQKIVQENIRLFKQKYFQQVGADFPPYFISSIIKGNCREEILDFVGDRAKGG